jgi:hypothetical protein
MSKVNGKNGTPLWLDIIRDHTIDLHPEVESMLVQMKIAYEDMPHQRSVAATFAAGNPSVEWVLAERRRQFASLALQFAMLRTDEEKDRFCDGMVEWWKLRRANEDRAEQHLAQHKRRAS